MMIPKATLSTGLYLYSLWRDTSPVQTANIHLFRLGRPGRTFTEGFVDDDGARLPSACYPWISPAQPTVELDRAEFEAAVARGLFPAGLVPVVEQTVARLKAEAAAGKFRLFRSS